MNTLVLSFRPLAREIGNYTITVNGNVFVVRVPAPREVDIQNTETFTYHDVITFPAPLEVDR